MRSLLTPLLTGSSLLLFGCATQIMQPNEGAVTGGPSLRAKNDSEGESGMTEDSEAPKTVGTEPSQRKKADNTIYPTGEELWIIEASPRGVVGESSRFANPRSLGRGELFTRGEDDSLIVLPLVGTSVAAQVSGHVASVDVGQRFDNPFDETIEILYAFPLPRDAAAQEFILEIGDRKIRGIVRERIEAERIYAAAKRQGIVATLLSESRGTVFTQKVANVEPKKRITVSMRYYGTIGYQGGWHEFVFPMRALAGMASADPEIAERRDGRNIKISVDVDAGVSIEEFELPTQEATIERNGDSRARVELVAKDAIPNRDFVLRYRVAGEETKSSILTHGDQNGGYFSLMLYPPAELERRARVPLDVVFLLDPFGGDDTPIKERDAVFGLCTASFQHALGLLGDRDLVRLIMLPSRPSPKMKRLPDAVRAGPGNSFMEEVTGAGGNAVDALHLAMSTPPSPGRRRVIVVIGSGHALTRLSQTSLVGAGDSRIGGFFALGVGPDVQRAAMVDLTRRLDGAVAIVPPGENPVSRIDRYFRQALRPALVNPRFEFTSFRVRDVLPSSISDVFLGRPLHLVGRYAASGDADAADGAVVVTGLVDGEEKSFRIPVNEGGHHPAVSVLWARRQIAELRRRDELIERPELRDEIRRIALAFGIVSEETAFLAVDPLSRAGSGKSRVVEIGE